MTDTAASSAQEVRDSISRARSRREPLRIVGGGTWIDAGSPVTTSHSLSLAGLTGILEYEPGDLTLTARAGTPLRVIAEATASENQWLALDPLGTDDGTIGATVATGSFGPLSSGFGLPRDLALGVEFVTGRGEVARAGGRVVKNVAGFDITRLMTGAWGTLGVITEITVRLHARPEVEANVAVEVQSPSELQRFLGSWPFTPSACELINAELAHRIGLRGTPLGLFRLAGNGDSVTAQRDQIRRLGDVIDFDVSVWSALRALLGQQWTLRLSGLRSVFAGTWGQAERIAAEWSDAMVSGSCSRGIVRCALPPNGGTDEHLGKTLSRLAPTACILERLPRDVWARLELAQPNALARRVRQTFDPESVLNPGILLHAI